MGNLLLVSMTTARFVVAIALWILLLGFVKGRVGVSANPNPGEGLFTEPLVSYTVQDLGEDATIFRSRPVGIDFTLFTVADGPLQNRPGKTLWLNLFGGVSFKAVLDHLQARSKNDFVWSGHIEGEEASQVTVVVQDGVMASNIRVKGALYQVRYAGGGVHSVREIDQSAFPPQHGDSEPIRVDLREEAQTESDVFVAFDDGSTLDVMVVYTPVARAAVGGTTAMNALINLAIAETNTAYSNSGVTPQLRLVHTEEVSYTESGDFSTDLNRLKDTADGFMDNVHTLRDTHAADMVSLFIEDPNSSVCGLGFIMTTESNFFERFAFNVVRQDCATGNFTFGHELGHNMGLKHDRTNDNADGVFPYSHGYVDIPNGFRTIMGVFSTCFSCTKIQHFSNPAVSFQGNPTGVDFQAADSADAARSLNDTADTVANWRESINQVLPPTLNSVSPDAGPTSGGTVVTLTGTDFVDGGTSVTFGGDAATNVSVNSATSLTATTPSHAAGAVDVVVTTPGGSATLALGFTYTLTELTNISTRGLVQTGDIVQIGGFIIGGTEPKTVLIRARGPTLADFGVPGELADPVLQLFFGQTVIAQSDNWQVTDPLCGSPAVSCGGETEIIATGLDPCVGNMAGCTREAAILVTLDPGSYTAIVSGVGGGTGVGLVEVFEVGTSTSRLTNISTRGLVGTGDDVMIGGFIIGGTEPKTVLVRARGPVLTDFGVPGELADPFLQLFSEQTVIAQNDNWQVTDPLCGSPAASCGGEAEIVATGLDPCVGNLTGCTQESAILVTLPPGPYTAIVSGVGGGMGVGLVEVFEVSN